MEIQNSNQSEWGVNLAFSDSEESSKGIQK